MMRQTLIGFLTLALSVAAIAGPAEDFTKAFNSNRFLEAAAKLPEIADQGTRGYAVEQMINILPLFQWNAQTASMWDLSLRAIETNNTYWIPRNLGAYIAALACPSVPRNAETAALIDRAVALGDKYKAQKVPAVVAQGLCWYGDFTRAFGLFGADPVPESTLDFAFETLADKPEYGKDPALCKLVIGKMGNAPSAAITRKAIRALAYAGQLDLAMQLADGRPTPEERVEGLIIAGQYSRHAKRLPGFEKAMQAALARLATVTDAGKALPLFRDIMNEAKILPITPLPDTFWQDAAKWANGLQAADKQTALAELAGAAAWAGRPDADKLLAGITDATWLPTAQLRVACGLYWSGKRDQAAAIANAIADPAWKAQALNELAYLAIQQNGQTSENKTNKEGQR